MGRIRFRKLARVSPCKIGPYQVELKDTGEFFDEVQDSSISPKDGV